MHLAEFDRPIATLIQQALCEDGMPRSLRSNADPQTAKKARLLRQAKARGLDVSPPTITPEQIIQAALAPPAAEMIVTDDKMLGESDQMNDGIPKRQVSLKELRRLINAGRRRKGLFTLYDMNRRSTASEEIFYNGEPVTFITIDTAGASNRVHSVRFFGGNKIRELVTFWAEPILIDDVAGPENDATHSPLPAVADEAQTTSMMDEPDYLSGRCHVFAVALHRAYGFAFVVLTDKRERYKGGIPAVHHIYAVDDKGNAYDCGGVHKTAEIISQWLHVDTGSWHRPGVVRIATERGLQKYISDDWNRPLDSYTDADVRAALVVARSKLPMNLIVTAYP